MDNREHFPSITEMLLKYAEIAEQTKSNTILFKVFNALELHFNVYANEQRQIYLEGIFKILHDFNENLTETLLVETMQRDGVQ